MQALGSAAGSSAVPTTATSSRPRQEPRTRVNDDRSTHWRNLPDPECSMNQQGHFLLRLLYLERGGQTRVSHGERALRWTASPRTPRGRACGDPACAPGNSCLWPRRGFSWSALERPGLIPESSSTPTSRGDRWARSRPWARVGSGVLCGASTTKEGETGRRTGTTFEWREWLGLTSL